MANKIITFIFQRPSILPVGGFKVVYEYANRCVRDGYKVNIVYDMFYYSRDASLFEKIKQLIRYTITQFTGHYSGRRWFNLDNRVKECFTRSMRYEDVPKSDVYVATAVDTSVYVNTYPVEKSRKLYFVQGYENWNISDEELRKTYHYDMKIVVISHWLKQIMNEEGVDSLLIPNGFDFKYYEMTVPIERKDKFTITMLYHGDERKGIKYGLKALEIVKSYYPNIKVNMFGTPVRPKNLPSWYEYHQSPDKHTINRLYNEGAIFLATSLVEGWGLTVGEAMICGEAVVCTEIDGFKEMCSNGVNALMVPIKDSEKLAESVMSLINNDELRMSLAKHGNNDIRKFDWETSFKLFKAEING